MTVEELKSTAIYGDYKVLMLKEIALQLAIANDLKQQQLEIEKDKLRELEFSVNLQSQELADRIAREEELSNLLKEDKA